MKCSECDGVGYKKISATSCAICERCGGMGEVKETNFDRITKSPEALAEFISKVTIAAWFAQANSELPKPNGSREWLAWLKQESE